MEKKVWLVYFQQGNKDPFVCRVFTTEAKAKEYEAWRDSFKNDEDLFWSTFMYLDDDF